MKLLDHVSIGVRDLTVVRPFYDAIMQALLCTKVYDRSNAFGCGERCRANTSHKAYLAVYQHDSAFDNPAYHWCFKTNSVAQVDTFYGNGIDAGGRCGGAPEFRASHHAAFLTDPSGNRLEVLFHNALPT